MAQIRQESRDHELRRWLRPDWRRFWKPGHEKDPLYREFERIERKFSPDQPRVPAGAREGGQWTSGSGSQGQTASDISSRRFGEPSIAPHKRVTEPKIRLAARISSARQEECELQLSRDKFICNTVGLRSCHAQAAERYSACLAGRPIPPLFF